MEEKFEEKKSVPEWKRKWIASRMTFESILFERELLTPKKEKDYRGIIAFISIFLFELFLLWLYFFKNNGLLSLSDIEKIKIAENYFSSLTTTGFWETLKTGQVYNFEMPFYYFTFFLIFKYLTSNYWLAIFILNSIYLFVIMFVTYSLITIRRNYQPGILGIAFLTAVPFISNLLRHFSPQLATIAFVSLSYYFFIKSEEFEDNRWIFPLALSVSFGILTDKFYLFYILPIVPWFGYAISGIFRASMLKGFLPGIIIGIPFYLRVFLQVLISLMIYGKDLFKDKNFNFFWYLVPSVNALSLIFFFIGAISLLWMYYALFMPYEKRKIVGKWFFFSYIAFWVFPFKSESYIYPALIPFAIATAIMTPRLVRKGLIIFILIFSFVNQIGLISEKNLFIKGKEINFIGLKSSPLKDEKIEEIMTLIKENISERNLFVSVFGGTQYLNPEVLESIANKYGMKNVKFANFKGDFLYFCDVLIVKGAENLKKLPPLFYSLYREKVSFNNRDITIFLKNVPQEYLLQAKNYKIKQFSFNGVNFSDVDINLYDFDGKVYKEAEVFISYATHQEVDSYGIRLALKDLCIALVDDRIIPCGFSGIKIKNLKITDFSLARFLENKFSLLKNISVEIDRNIEISGTLKEKDLIISGNLKQDKDFLIFSVEKFYYAGFEFPSWFYYFLNFKIYFKNFPIEIETGNIKMKKAMIEIS